MERWKINGGRLRKDGRPESDQYLFGLTGAMPKLETHVTPVELVDGYR